MLDSAQITYKSARIVLTDVKARLSATQDFSGQRASSISDTKAVQALLEGIKAGKMDATGQDVPPFLLGLIELPETDVAVLGIVAKQIPIVAEDHRASLLQAIISSERTDHNVLADAAARIPLCPSDQQLVLVRAIINASEQIESSWARFRVLGTIARTIPTYAVDHRAQISISLIKSCPTVTTSTLHHFLASIAMAIPSCPIDQQVTLVEALITASWSVVNVPIDRDELHKAIADASIACAKNQQLSIVEALIGNSNPRSGLSSNGLNAIVDNIKCYPEDLRASVVCALMGTLWVYNEEVIACDQRLAFKIADAIQHCGQDQQPTIVATFLAKFGGTTKIRERVKRFLPKEPDFSGVLCGLRYGPT